MLALQSPLLVLALTTQATASDDAGGDAEKEVQEEEHESQVQEREASKMPLARAEDIG